MVPFSFTGEWSVGTVPDVILGRTGRRVTRVGLGGEGILRTHGLADQARAVIDEAVGQGITYFDSARAYDGSEAYLGEFWAGYPEARGRVFQTSKSASRESEGAGADLARSLSNLRADHLDLWQIHDLRTWDDIREIEGEGGALDAFLRARKEGLVRHIGVTGHHDPAVLTHAVEHWPVETVLLPVNPVEGILGGFTSETIPAARERGLGIIGMKVLGGSHLLAPPAGITAMMLIRYALSRGVTLAIVGCSTPAEVLTLATAGRDHQPMEPGEMARLEEKFRPYARELAYYRGWG
jgi:aryl-alcohol dehydrogenase-like predicted oxidoreductase